MPEKGGAGPVLPCSLFLQNLDAVENFVEVIVINVLEPEVAGVARSGPEYHDFELVHLAHAGLGSSSQCSSISAREEISLRSCSSGGRQEEFLRIL